MKTRNPMNTATGRPMNSPSVKARSPMRKANKTWIHWRNRSSGNRKNSDCKTETLCAGWWTLWRSPGPNSTKTAWSSGKTTGNKAKHLLDRISFTILPTTSWLWNLTWSTAEIIYLTLTSSYVQTNRRTLKLFRSTLKLYKELRTLSNTGISLDWCTSSIWDCQYSSQVSQVFILIQYAKFRSSSHAK